MLSPQIISKDFIFKEKRGGVKPRVITVPFPLWDTASFKVMLIW
jgi:hypothetical protein